MSLCPNFTVENAILLFNFAKIALKSAKIGYYYAEYGLSTSKHIDFWVIFWVHEKSDP